MAYSSKPGRLLYTNISDQYTPLSTKVINVSVRDSTYGIDGLVYQRSDLRIQEQCTDTAGCLLHAVGTVCMPAREEGRAWRMVDVMVNGSRYSADSGQTQKSASFLLLPHGHRIDHACP